MLSRREAGRQLLEPRVRRRHDGVRVPGRENLRLRVPYHGFSDILGACAVVLLQL